MLNINNNLDWIAGFFDGEGSIGIYGNSARKNVHYFLTCSLSQIHLPILEELKMLFGGYINDITYTNNNRNAADAWQWRIQALEAFQFLKQIEPKLQIKGDEANLAMKFYITRQEMIKRKDNPKLIVAWGESCSNELKQLKKDRKHYSSIRRNS